MIKDLIYAVCFLLLIVIVALVILNRPFLSQLLAKIRGRTDEIMSKDAMTPEGAADYYNNAIREKEVNVTKANQLFIEITGKLDSTEKELYDTKKQMMQIDLKINSAIDSGKDDDAILFQKKKETFITKSESLKEVIEELKKSKDQQQEIKEQMEKELEDLKQEKDKTIFELQANNQIIKLHESMNNNMTTSESDRMLEKVRAGANKTKEMAAGSKIAYESSLNTMERRAEQSAKDEEARKKIEELKKKRGKA